MNISNYLILTLNKVNPMKIILKTVIIKHLWYIMSYKKLLREQFLVNWLWATVSYEIPATVILQL